MPGAAACARAIGGQKFQAHDRAARVALRAVSSQPGRSLAGQKGPRTFWSGACALAWKGVGGAWASGAGAEDGLLAPGDVSLREAVDRFW